MESNLSLGGAGSLDIGIQAEFYNVMFCLDSGFFHDDEKNFAFPYHSHAEYELHIMTQGTGRIFLGEREACLAEGACCLVPPNVYHAQKFNGTKVRKRCLRFSLSRMGDEEGSAGQAPFAPGKDYLWQDDGELAGQFERILRELDRARPLQQAMLQAYFAEVFITLLRVIGIEDSRPVPEGIEQNTLRRITRIEYFFNANYRQKVTIDDLARELYISRRQVSREVRRYFGMSFQEKLITTRVEIAKGFLEQSKDSIEAIAYSVGYESLASFSTAFKQCTGMPPSAYRRRCIHRNER